MNLSGWCWSIMTRRIVPGWTPGTPTGFFLSAFKLPMQSQMPVKSWRLRKPFLSTLQTRSYKMDTTEIKLTRYSHGAGCGCKISPAILDKILHSTTVTPGNPNLLVGNLKRDDAAVLDLGNGTALISTTDFFMPIVDDAFDFGRIASANAISDVYAMGGRPVLAIAILGWPINQLPPELAQRVLEGARAICAEAGITLAGGHSIDCPEPVFGLAVNGLVAITDLKRNSTATAGCKLYLTKPLGVGIL